MSTPTGWRGNSAPLSVVLTDGATLSTAIGTSANPLASTSSAADILLLGANTETAPATDTASSGQNGRLQRVAQNLTSQSPTSTSRIVSAANTTNATSAKVTPGRIFMASGYNANASGRYLKIYNLATAPTVGTDTPIITKYLPGSAAFVFDWLNGYIMSVGISYALTTGSADSDTGALTAGDVLGFNLDYV